MKINNEFKVDLPPAEAWPMLLDIPGVVPCMPGAELLGVEEDKSYRGKVTVKLGPVTVAFQGKARLEQVDEASRRVRMKAQGTELKGRGSAQADVVFQLAPDGSGTRVKVETDLNLAGAVAQYGRAQSVIADVAQIIIDQFAENLRKKIATQPRAAAASAGPASASATSVATPVAPAVSSSPPVVSKPAALSAFAVFLALLKRWLGIGK